MYRVSMALGVVGALTATAIIRPDIAHFVFSAGVPPPNVTKAIGTPVPPKLELPDSAASDHITPSFDVLRVDPQGPAVFAGQAPPNAEVTVFANGQAVAAAKADPSGAWAAVAQREFAPAEYEFSVRATSGEHGDVTVGQRVSMTVAPMVGNGAPARMRDIASVAATLAPITFVYNETTFTDEGQKAAAVLAQHLVAHRFSAVSLSGHADERGSDEYNLQLSRQRLQVVSAYLRDHGFVGTLELIAKGKSEPYTGVDRRAVSQEEVFQLDRRVELRLAR
jgi:outer membrane protein OmpA-like peptidoglycan-associated protein